MRKVKSRFALARIYDIIKKKQYFEFTLSPLSFVIIARSELTSCHSYLLSMHKKMHTNSEYQWNLMMVTYIRLFIFVTAILEAIGHIANVYQPAIKMFSFI